MCDRPLVAKVIWFKECECLVRPASLDAVALGRHDVSLVARKQRRCRLHLAYQRRSLDLGVIRISVSSRPQIIIYVPTRTSVCPAPFGFFFALSSFYQLARSVPAQGRREPSKPRGREIGGGFALKSREIRQSVFSRGNLRGKAKSRAHGPCPALPNACVNLILMSRQPARIEFLNCSSSPLKGP